MEQGSDSSLNERKEPLTLGSAFEGIFANYRGKIIVLERTGGLIVQVMESSEGIDPFPAKYAFIHPDNLSRTESKLGVSLGKGDTIVFQKFFKNKVRHEIEEIKVTPANSRLVISFR